MNTYPKHISSISAISPDVTYMNSRRDLCKLCEMSFCGDMKNWFEHLLLDEQTIGIYSWLSNWQLVTIDRSHCRLCEWSAVGVAGVAVGAVTWPKNESENWKRSRKRKRKRIWISMRNLLTASWFRWCSITGSTNSGQMSFWCLRHCVLRAAKLSNKTSGKRARNLRRQPHA